MKLIRYLVAAGLFFPGACNTRNSFDSKNASKPSQLAEGKKLYESKCARCHDIGMSGAPKLGDKKDWSDRIVDGEDVMLRKAIAGIEGKSGMMPPKGGNYSLSDEDVKIAILYMVSTIDTSEENTSVASPALKR
jgi:cytochrome c5